MQEMREHPLTYLQVKKEIEKGDVRPVYFFYGTETYLMEDLIQTITSKVVGEERQDVVTTYSLQEIPIEDVIEDAETFSFFGGKKVIVAKDFTAPLSSKKKEEKTVHNWNVLETYITNPSEATHLILISEEEKVDARKKITKALQENTVVVNCKPFDEKTMDAWLKMQAERYNITFDDVAKEKLVTKVGTNLFLLVSEMEKLALYVGEGGTVTEQHVDHLTARSLEQDIFSLIDKALKKKLDEAIVIYHDLLKQREEPLLILILIARQLRIYYQVKLLSQRSYSQKQIATQLKLHPYVVKLAMREINRFEEERLLSLLKEVANTDYAIKSGRMDKQLAVELLLIKLAA